MRTKSNREQNYNIEDAAQLLGILTATMQNWIRLGKLHPDASDKQFGGAYLKSFISSLCAQDSVKLKSRRNKTYISLKLNNFSNLDIKKYKKSPQNLKNLLQNKISYAIIQNVVGRHTNSALPNKQKTAIGRVALAVQSPI